MKKRLLMVLLSVLAPFILYAGDYDFAIDMGKLQFEWKVDGSNLNIFLKAKTKGWVGVGFNPKKMMKGANILIGKVKGSKVTIRDDYGSARDKHKSDKKLGGKKNVTNISGSEIAGVTELKFTIPLNSGDSKDTSIDVNKDITMIFAYGNSDSFRLGHKFVKTISVNLSTGKYQ
ncbi:MAG: hypothetical protein HOD92_13260 [Deltaproteobacteria bacterium]|jgi:hypothetical protein|nr:hypothetical protein [Deltaproteobacteria bacterium]MBT4526265.1 hypothetical protein [Deltaproteobacteria bacterium]